MPEGNKFPPRQSMQGTSREDKKWISPTSSHHTNLQLLLSIHGYQGITVLPEAGGHNQTVYTIIKLNSSLATALGIIKLSQYHPCTLCPCASIVGEPGQTKRCPASCFVLLRSWTTAKDSTDKPKSALFSCCVQKRITLSRFLR